jgi:hypothetical protein
MMDPCSRELLNRNPRSYLRTLPNFTGAFNQHRSLRVIRPLVNRVIVSMDIAKGRRARLVRLRVRCIKARGGDGRVRGLHSSVLFVHPLLRIEMTIPSCHGIEVYSVASMACSEYNVTLGFDSVGKTKGTLSVSRFISNFQFFQVLSPLIWPSWTYLQWLDHSGVPHEGK